MRLALVISSLGPGGAEKVLAGMAGWWAQRGHDVSLVTISDSSDDHWPLDPAVERVALGLASDSRSLPAALVANARRVHALRRALAQRRPDAAIAFMGSPSVVTLLATRGLGVPVVVSEHQLPSLPEAGRRRWAMLRRFTYPAARAVVVVTDESATWARRAARSRPVVAIPNPVAAPAHPAGSDRPDGPPTIVGMGRLAPEKGFDLLVRAFARVAAERPEWRLAVHGEGPERWRLEALVAELGLAARVSLPGLLRDPAEAFAAATVFALSSRSEGFPNVLLEAMAHGVPVVAAAASGAIPQIVRDGVDGLLVPAGSVDVLAEGLARLMDDPSLRSSLASRAPEVVERYSVEGVMARWEDVIRDAVRA